MADPMKDIRQINPDIVIATGKSRFSKDWKTKQMPWLDLVERLGATTRTGETVEDYRRMGKAKRDNLKDVGGFVGGGIKGKQRLTTSVQNRSLITLDMDNIISRTVADIIADYELFFGYEAVIYSTHSHTPKKPRLRLVIPTDRPMSADEYEAVARRIAGDIGIDMFDDTTYEIARMMFFPSTPIDGEYIFEHIKGNLIGVDTLLDSYRDWRDVSEWPLSSRQTDIVQQAMTKQEDPLTKKGIVGAFCKTYSITEVIAEYLSDTYTPTRHGDRYTYAAGSTYGGLVIYDNKFAYSHHGTDPISRQLCNAFDLVRLHKYGAMDADAKQGTPMNRMPSYLKMVETAQADAKVKRHITEERLQAAETDFEFLDGEDNANWMQELEYDKQNNLKNTINNIVLVGENDPNLKGKFHYDAFSNRAIVDAGLPWGKHQERHDWQDVDDSGFHHYLEEVYGLQHQSKVEDAKNIIFDNHRYHPVREYFASLPEWDEVPRVESILIDYLGAEDNIYTRAVAKAHLVAAVKRVFQPGSKYDTMVTLAGKQGIGKSTFIAKLAKDWFSDSVYTIRGKEAAELIQGVWHVELGEMSALKKADRDAVKGFLSKRDDIFRVAYAKNTSRFPRQCVFWGTSNEYNFLRDPTGDRRNFPIVCGIAAPTKDIFQDLNGEVDQIWAEAYRMYLADEKTYLTGRALEISIEVQEEHKEDAPWRGLILEYLDDDYPTNWFDLEPDERQLWLSGARNLPEFSGEIQKLDRVCALQIWVEALKGRPEKITTYDSVQIHDILTGLPGWERKTHPQRFGKAYGRQRAFIRLK